MSISNADKTSNAITRDQADSVFKILLEAAVREHVRTKDRRLPHETRAEAFARLQRACAVLSESQPSMPR